MKYIFTAFVVFIVVLFIVCVMSPPIVESTGKESRFVLESSIENVLSALRKEDTLKEIMVKNGIEVLDEQTIDKNFKLKRLRKPMAWDFQSESLATIKVIEDGSIMKVRQHVAADQDSIEVNIVLEQRTWALSDFRNSMRFERYGDKTLVRSYIFVEANPQMPGLSIVRKIAKEKVTESVDKATLDNERTLKDVLQRKTSHRPLFNWRFR